MSDLMPSRDDGTSQVYPPQGATLEFEERVAVEHPQGAADLSSEILRTLPCARGEWLTCRRVGNSHYRCNWWSRRESGGDENPLPSGLRVTTHRVSRSEFIHALKTDGGLTMTMASAASAPSRVILQESAMKIIRSRTEGAINES
jgi:hypothetical protein